MSALLEVQDVTVRFGGLTAISGVSFSVGPAEIVSVIGPNGAGKSTPINCISGFQQVATGSIRLGGRPLAKLDPASISRAGIGRTFQTPQLFGRLSVAEGIQIARPSKGHSPFAIPDILALTSLTDWKNKPAASLPYGPQRLVEVARALACDPRLLLLDEPAAGLSGEEIKGLQSLLRHVASELGLAIVLVEHNVGLVRSLSDRIVVMHHGQVLAEGEPDEVLADPVVIAAYLGGHRAPGLS